MLTLSASQVTVFKDECRRKWGLKSIAKLPVPEHPAAALGKEVDDTQLQPYLRDGRAFDYTRASGSGDIAASSLAFLPEPKSHGLEVQKHFTFRSLAAPSQLSYQGYVDLWMPAGGMPVPEPFVSISMTEGCTPSVCDFKTTGNLKWQKNASTLSTDVQAMMYATFAMVATPARIVDLVWIYMQTKGARKAKRTHLRVSAPHVFEQFKKIDAVGVEMMKTRKAVEARIAEGLTAEQACLELPLPESETACDMFGGCPFRSNCNLSPNAFNQLPELETTDMGDTASLMAELAAKRKKTVVVEAVGINPPESKLPPPAPEPRAEVQEQEQAEPAKKKPARTKKDEAPTDCHPGATHDEAHRHQRIGALVVELSSLLRGGV